MLAWHLGWRYLRRRRVAWLAVASITLTVAIPIVVLSVVHGFVDITARQARAQESDITVQDWSDGSGLAPVPDLVRLLREHPGVAGIAPFTDTFAVVQRRGPQATTAYTQAYGIDWRAEAALGRITPAVLHRAPITDLSAPPLPPERRGTGFLTTAWRDHTALVGLDVGLGMPMPMPPRPTPVPGVVIGSELLYGAGIPVGSRLSFVGVQGRTMGEISDTLATGLLEVDKLTSLLPLPQGQALTGYDGRPGHQARITGWRVALHPGQHLPSCAHRLRESTGLRVETWMDRRGNLVKSFEISRNILALVMIAIQGIAVFIVYAVFSTLVAEKRHDIGVLLGLGARRRDIAGAFLVAGLAACLVGGASGWILGWGMVAALNPLSHLLGVPLFPQDVMYLPETPVSFDPAIPLFFVAVMTVVGLVAVTLPAWRASRIAPVDILREGA